MNRSPAVAGKFYSSSDSELRKEVASYIKKDLPKEDVICAISPHAGYMYSGGVAGAVFSRINYPKSIILIGPNHTGMGEKISIYSKGDWELPNGNVKIDDLLSNQIIKNTKLIKEDVQSHVWEHSLEVQIPFIQFFFKDFKIVPIVIKYIDLESCKEIGNAISQAISNYSEKVLIIVSSDMTHYEPDSAVRKKDKMAIDKIINLDPEGLYNVVKTKNITMCGFIPAVIGLFASLKLNAKSAEVVGYATSGEINNDYNSVVGYAGIIIKE